MNKHLQIPVLIIIMLIYSIGIIHSQTEQYKFRHLTTNDGLPSNYTWSVMKDSHGFMWFTTRAGLCRYDGYNMKVFQYDPKDTTSISDIYVRSTIVEDTSGYIWVGSINGLNKLNPKTEKFIRYKNDPDDSLSIGGNFVRRVYLDRKGTVWIGIQGRGLHRYNPRTNNFIRYLPSPDNALRSNTVIGMYEDSSGNFWVGTTSGLYQFNRATGEFSLIEFLTNPGERINNRFTTITEDAAGNIWYCANKIYIYNPVNKKLKRFIGFPDSLIEEQYPKYMDILLDTLNNKQSLWIAKRSLYKYDLQTKKIIVTGNDPTKLERYIGLSPRAFYLDPSGSIWIATVNGITIMDPRRNTIQTHPEFARKYQIYATEFLKDSKGHFWIGIQEKGLLHLDENMNMIHRYSPSREGNSQNAFYGTIKKIMEDRNQNIWILCNKDGVYLLDRKKNRFNRCELIKNGTGIIPNNLYDIYEDSQGTIWVGSSGLFYRHKEADGPAPFQLDTSHYVFRNNTITDIEEDHAGNLWIGSNTGGLICKQKGAKDNDRYTWYSHDPDDQYSLSNKYIWSVYVDNKGIIWVGTNQGLNRFLDDQNGFEHYLTDLKSGAGFIYDIKEDKSGHLWLTTEQGLIRFEPLHNKKPDIEGSRIQEFLPFSKIFPYHFYMDEDQKFYIGSAAGTGNGYYSFYPDSITENTLLPPVVITEFLIRNEATELDSSITAKKEIDLRHNENFFSFEFAALDYIDPSQNQYAYKLEGVDDDWIYSGNRRFANYTSVPPGNYIFRVKGSNSDGIWNEVGASVSITILPPPWRTWWAYVLYAVILIGLIYLWRKYDLKRQRLKQELELEHIQTEKLEEIDRMKSRFFANISHEFRTPLTLILGPLGKHLPEIKDQGLKKDLNIIQSNALRLQRLINQLLTLSKLESGKMKLVAGEENIVKLVREYSQSFESLATQKGIEFTFHCNENSIPIYVDRDKLEKILFNLLSNAFKFTLDAGRIEVQIRRDQPISDNVIISVSDTGPGISSDKLHHIFDRFYQAEDSYTKDQEGTGIGLALTKELVELHHGKIAVESKEGKGTSIVVVIPLGKDHLKADEIISKSVDSKRLTVDAGVLEIESKDIKQTNTLPKTHVGTDSKPVLLIVEDNTDLRSYIRGYLDESYQVLESVNGREGLEKAIDQIPDLVISDVMMPEMDGFEFCNKMKANPLTCHIPVILLTARDSSESKIVGLETGADDYISKPFDPKELQVRIQNLIVQRQMLREKFSSDLRMEEQGSLLKIPLTGLGEMDKTFLQNALKVVENQMAETEFDVVSFSMEMLVSRQQLHRKLKALIGLSTTEFVRTIRLNKAASLLTTRSGTISEIAYDVGFNTLSYFTKSFQQQFGITPSQYIEKHVRNKY